MAKRIIATAKTGERDPARLRDVALAVLGGPLTRACTHKIANGDSDLINSALVRFVDSSQTFPKVRKVPFSDLG